MTRTHRRTSTLKTLGIAAIALIMALVLMTALSTPASAAAGDATGAPVITGNPQVAQVLTADTFSVDDPDGISGATFTYQWVQVASDSTETNISGATGSAYRLKAADSGKTVKVTVSFTDDAGNAEAVTSAVYPGTGTITTPEGPYPVSANITVSGTFVTATFNENLGTGGNAPPTSAFKVKLNGRATVAGSSSVSGKKVHLANLVPEIEPPPTGERRLSPHPNHGHHHGQLQRPLGGGRHSSPPGQRRQ